MTETMPTEPSPEELKQLQERREFAVEEICQLLKTIDGKEHPDLVMGERVENIKGELMAVTFTTGEKETVEGIEHEITYLLTFAGQRYNADGSEGRLVSRTYLTKDLDDGRFWSDELADYVNNEWVYLVPVAQSTSTSNLEQEKE